MQPSSGCLYVPYGGEELSFNSYEVLVEPLQWIGASDGEVPHGAVKSGQDPDTGDAYYVGRGDVDGMLIPGKVHPSNGCLYVPYGELLFLAILLFFENILMF